jgi:hypothetical protein
MHWSGLPPCVAMCLTGVNPAVAGVRNDGYYSNASRGKRNKNAQGERIHSILEPEELSKEHRKNWASLIQNIYEPTDPLTCPKCQRKNSPVFSVEVPISCGTIYVLKNSVFCYITQTTSEYSPIRFEY